MCAASTYYFARRTMSCTRQAFVRDIGRHCTSDTASPTLHPSVSSCACIRVDRRMYFLYRGCFTRRSTSTVTVLLILLLSTRPINGRVVAFGSLESIFGMLARLMSGFALSVLSSTWRGRDAMSLFDWGATAVLFPSAFAD